MAGINIDELVNFMRDRFILKSKERIIELQKENEELKKTLKEIKNIANHCMEQDLCTFCNYNDKCYKGFEDEALSYDVCKLILQKISEVIDDKAD